MASSILSVSIVQMKPNWEKTPIKTEKMAINQKAILLLKSECKRTSLVEVNTEAKQSNIKHKHK